MYKLARKEGIVDASMGFKDTVKRQIILPQDVAINYPKDYPTHIEIARPVAEMISSRYDYWQPCYADGGIRTFTHENGWDYSNIYNELKKERVM